MDPIDEVALSSLSKYKEKKFVDISKEDLYLGNCLLIIIVELLSWWPFDYSCHIWTDRFLLELSIQVFAVSF